MADASPGDEASLRLEHDSLARRLEVRPSVDTARNGFVWGFAGLMSVALSWALLWDRWDKVDPTDLGVRYPVAYLTVSAVALALGVALLVRAGAVLRRSRRMARDEAALFARLCELRRLLGIDP